MNVFLHARGNKSVNPLTLVSAAANVGSGNVAGNIFKQIDVGTAQLRDELRWRRIGIPLGIGSGHQIRRNDKFKCFSADAGAIGDDEVSQPQQRFVFFPHRNIKKSVGANNEKNAVAVSVISVAKVAHRIHGIM